MAVMHNSDILARVLEYANVQRAAARRWCFSKAWLRPHDTPALWRTLTLTALPTDAPAHCLVSAWARAPQRLRAVVERHTRCVIIADGGPSDTTTIPQTPYTLGSGLAGQQFARLERAVIQVGNRNSAQGYAADRAALEPLFGVAWLETRLDYFGNGFLSLERSRGVLSKLSKRPAPIYLDGTQPFLCAQKMRTPGTSVRTASWHMMAKNMIIDFWTASRQLSSSN